MDEVYDNFRNYAFEQAKKIFAGELLIDPDHTWFDTGNGIKFEEL